MSDAVPEPCPVPSLSAGDRALGWRGSSAYRRPRAPASAVPVEQFDDDLADLGR
jgi:hypothetical protein